MHCRVFSKHPLIILSHLFLARTQKMHRLRRERVVGRLVTCWDTRRVRTCTVSWRCKCWADGKLWLSSVPQQASLLTAAISKLASVRKKVVVWQPHPQSQQSAECNTISTNKRPMVFTVFFFKIEGLLSKLIVLRKVLVRRHQAERSNWEFIGTMCQQDAKGHANHDTRYINKIVRCRNAK